MSQGNVGCLERATVRLLIAEQLPVEELPRVAVHLSTCAKCRDRIVSAADEPASSAPAPASLPPRISAALTRGYWERAGDVTGQDECVDGLSTGQIINEKYRLVTLLGRGGNGSVWRAERLDWQASVAIKILNSDDEASGESVARFLREVRLAAALRSPHVVQVLDHGVDDLSARPFIIMELLEGDTLERRLKRSNRLSPSETVRILQHVVRALHRAHSMSIVHRDLKPANIFIVRNADQEVVKVLDFGVAKWRTPGTHSWMTMPGTILGTPWYMSPEQIRDSTNLDHHADLWALAVIACECLTGRRPFQGRDFVELALLLQDLERRPIPSRLGPAPAGFDQWFARATLPDRSQRFPSAREAFDGLVRVCGDADKNTGDPRSAGPLAKNRRARQRSANAVAVLAAISAAIVSWFVASQPQRGPLPPGAEASTPAVEQPPIIDAPKGGTSTAMEALRPTEENLGPVGVAQLVSSDAGAVAAAATPAASPRARARVPRTAHPSVPQMRTNASPGVVLSPPNDPDGTLEEGPGPTINGRRIRTSLE